MSDSYVRFSDDLETPDPDEEQTFAEIRDVMRQLREMMFDPVSACRPVRSCQKPWAPER